MFKKILTKNILAIGRLFWETLYTNGDCSMDGMSERMLVGWMDWWMNGLSDGISPGGSQKIL